VSNCTQTKLFFHKGVPKWKEIKKKYVIEVREKNNGRVFDNEGRYEQIRVITNLPNTEQSSKGKG